ncbi:hypothetical protein CR513_54468, partial [Mucuna pruriens]
MVMQKEGMSLGSKFKFQSKRAPKWFYGGQLREYFNIFQSFRDSSISASTEIQKGHVSDLTLFVGAEIIKSCDSFVVHNLVVNPYETESILKLSHSLPLIMYLKGTVNLNLQIKISVDLDITDYSNAN